MNTRAEAAANVLRQEQAIHGFPVDVFMIAQNLGADVVRTSMANEISGMLVRDDHHLAIGVNRLHPRSRQNFTVAHELGHLLMHRGRPLIVDSSVRVNFRDPTSASATNREEIEANAFAAALLMPKDFVIHAVADLPTPADPDSIADTLAPHFGVSGSAMHFRLVNLGLLSSS